MSDLQPTPARIDAVIQDLHNPALLAHATETGSDGRDIDKALRLASVLQTSLDLRRIVEMFAHEVARWFTFQSVTYENSEANLHIDIGPTAKHALSFRLVVAEQSLGTLTFTRRRRFSPRESQGLDFLCCALVFPLKNAVSYHRALQAALQDPLTGVGNRAAMDRAVLREIEFARRYDTPLSLIAADIDFFKHINDSHGHATGDCVLRAVADAIRDTVRATDVVFRYGGEEFMILLSNTGAHGANLLAERIRKRVEETEISCHGVGIRATISLGVAHLGNTDDSSTLFQHADTALYSAKAGGRNCVRLAL